MAAVDAASENDAVVRVDIYLVEVLDGEIARLEGVASVDADAGRVREGPVGL